MVEQQRVRTNIMLKVECIYACLPMIVWLIKPAQIARSYLYYIKAYRMDFSPS